MAPSILQEGLVLLGLSVQLLCGAQLRDSCLMAGAYVSGCSISLGSSLGLGDSETSLPLSQLIIDILQLTRLQLLLLQSRIQAQG